MVKTLLLAPIAIAILVLSFDVRAEEGGSEKLLFEDRFEKQLGQGWTWVRENRNAWRIEADALEIKA